MIAIPVLGNLIWQPDRTFTVELTGVDGGSTSFGFGTQQPFSTGAGPFSVAAGDFNGDGKPDLAVANTNSNTVSILLNTTAPGATTPSFAPRQDFATAADPEFVVVGDFNLDNKPDLAIVEPGSNVVSVFLNTTAPGSAIVSFAPRQDFPTGLGPASAAVGDFNGDGALDLAVVNKSSNSVSVLLNTTAPGSAAPSFAARQDFATGSRPVSVAMGDLNDDGILDLAIANSNSNSTSVLLNTTGVGAAAPSFAAKQDWATGTEPASVALADYNGDGTLDLAVANFRSNTVSVLLNTTGPSATMTRTMAVGTILDDDSPASIVPAGGDNQWAILGATFATPLAVNVYNANGHPVQGVSVTFTAPAGGASGTFAGGGEDSVTVVTDANGLATAPAFMANDTAGSDIVRAQAAGLATIAEFHLSNIYGVDALYDPSLAKRSGSTIPLRLEITNDAGDNMGSTDLPIQALFVVGQDGNQAPLQSPGNANPDNLFQYDLQTDFYQFNLKTRGYSTGLYTLYFQVGDDPTLYSLSFAVS